MRGGTLPGHVPCGYLWTVLGRHHRWQEAGALLHLLAPSSRENLLTNGSCGTLPSTVALGRRPLPPTLPVAAVINYLTSHLSHFTPNGYLHAMERSQRSQQRAASTTSATATKIFRNDNNHSLNVHTDPLQGGTIAVGSPASLTAAQRSSREVATMIRGFCAVKRWEAQHYSQQQLSSTAAAVLDDETKFGTKVLNHIITTGVGDCRATHPDRLRPSSLTQLKS